MPKGVTVTRLRKKFRLLPVLTALFLAACSNIECPLDNIVVATCGLYTAEDGNPLTLEDSLTIRPAGRDILLLNRAQGISSFVLPLRNAAGTDTLLLRFSNARKQVATDTLFLTHTTQPHFESIDCPTAVFHALTAVRWTSHALGVMPLTLDSVALVRSTVNYDDIENLQLYLRATSSR
ncbi:MAG: hypothetical protein IJ722_06520 [Alloprevotella sp.]|nr:hypothetical protein [Alloprevotella sp.]